MKSTTTTGIIRSFPSFDYFLEKAKHRISHISQKRQEELKDMLNHGEAYLNNSDLLDMYLCCYGDMHRVTIQRIVTDVLNYLKVC